MNCFSPRRPPIDSYCRRLFCKVLSNFHCNLSIRHLVNCFNTYNPSAQLDSLKTFLQFALGLTRTKYQKSFGIPNTRNDRIVVNVEMSRKRSLTVIICRYLP